MALIYHAGNKEQSVKAHGSWFTFKPKQIKEMQEDKVRFLTSVCAYMGFVELPESMEDLEFRNSAEGKKIIKEADEVGVKARVLYLERLKHNELVSLKRDIDKHQLGYDPRLDMSEQMVENLKELAGYKKGNAEAENEKISKIKELESLLEG